MVCIFQYVVISICIDALELKGSFTYWKLWREEHEIFSWHMAHIQATLKLITMLLKPWTCASNNLHFLEWNMTFPLFVVLVAPRTCTKNIVKILFWHNDVANESNHVKNMCHVFSRVLYKWTNLRHSLLREHLPQLDLGSL